MRGHTTVAAVLLIFWMLASSCDAESDRLDARRLGLRSSTASLIAQMAEAGKVFVFDKDKTLLGGSTSSKVRKPWLVAMRAYGADIAILTSNTSKEDGEYTAIAQLQKKFGEGVFPDAFFETDAFQVNEKKGDKTKADEMGEIIAHFGVQPGDVVFFDDKTYNLTDVAAVYPAVVGVKVDPETGMVEADLVKGMKAALGVGGPSGCATQCSPSCPCAEGEGDCDQDADCQPGLECPPDEKGAELCEAISCQGKCSPACPCSAGEGDCDVDVDCQAGLVCPPDGPGPEACEAPSQSQDCAGQCSPSCPCAEGQGDCDVDADCQSGLVCPPDGPGGEVCEAPGPSQDCAGQCSPACPCAEGEGDCDVDADCQAGLVCPPDGPGGEACEAPGPSQGCDDQCSPSCPCAEGEGDCDVDADCQPGLVCPADGPGKEACEAPSQSQGCDGKCSPSCPCAEGEGDCDVDADCLPGLVCPPDAPGGEECEVPSQSQDCEGQCSPACPCGEGEGDCDVDADCQSGLVCPPDGPGGEQCEVPGQSSGQPKSNLQVKLDGSWKGVCCKDGELEVSNDACDWEEHGRVLETKDVKTGKDIALDCPENGQKPTDCDCSPDGERMHGVKDGKDVHVENSLSLPNGAPIFPNSGHETCVDRVNGELRTRWTSGSCPDWRLTNFY